VILNRLRPQSVYRVRWELLLIIFLLAACTQAESRPLAFSPITLEEFPDELGRGFPVAQNVEEEGLARVGEAAPNFAFVLDDNQGAQLADLQGKPVVLNFWASWCGPCRLEMPDLVALHEHDEEIVVLTINVREDVAQAQPFAEEFGMTMPVIMDTEGALQRRYGVMGLPVTIFINRQGQIASRWNGLLTAAVLEERVAALR
jgi:cytochrome c biogenesis protein CcmG, thiol:disulfide interchange protein DsbE